MDFSHGLIAVAGLVTGYLVFGTSSAPAVVERPCSCHCSCAVPETSGIRSWDVILVCVAGGSLGIGILGLVSRALPAGVGTSPEFSFSFKGKSGKGTLGAKRGLQILDG